MTYEIQNNRPAAALTEAFDLKGRVRPELEEFIVPTVLVADVSQNSPPAIQRAVTAYWSQAAAIGQRSCFQFHCPGGTLAKIKRISFFSTGLTAADAWFLLFSGSTLAGGISGSTATSSFTDGRLQQTGVAPSCSITYGTRVSAVPADWAIPLFMTDQTYGSAQVAFEPQWGWVVGSGLQGITSYIEASFDGVNMPSASVMEWEEFQVG